MALVVGMLLKSVREEAVLLRRLLVAQGQRHPEEQAFLTQLLVHRYLMLAAVVAVGITAIHLERVALEGVETGQHRRPPEIRVMLILAAAAVETAVVGRAIHPVVQAALV